MQNFVAALSLSTPWMPGPHGKTGDGVMAGIQYAMCRDYVRAMELPLACIEGVPQISTVLLAASSVRRHMRAAFIQNFTHFLEHDRDAAHLLDRMPAKTHRNPSSGSSAIVMNTYPIVPTPTLFFAGRGDVDAVARIFNSTPAIGKKHSTGFGELAKIEVLPVKTGNPHHGIVMNRRGRNVLLRPVPARLRHLFPHQLDLRTHTGTWRNPYNPEKWDATVEECMIPPGLHRLGTFSPEDFE